jgi:hypothetical protein
MTQQYQIALAPELGITPEAFIAAWNVHQATEAVGRVGLSQTTRSTFDPGTAALLLTAASGIAIGVLTNLISDIIIKASQPQKEPEIRQQTLADGSKVIIVTIRES